MIFILIVLTDPVESSTVWGGQPLPPPPLGFVLTVSMDKRRKEERHKVPNDILRSLSNDDGNGRENVTQKNEFALNQTSSLLLQLFKFVKYWQFSSS